MNYTNMKKMTALVSLSVISVLTLFGLQQRNTRTNYPAIRADIPTLYDTKTIEIVKADFGLTTKNNTAFTVVKGTGNETFTYTGTTNQTSTGATNPWFTLKSTAAQQFTQASESGSVLNKWHLTSITIVYSKVAVTETTGQTNIVKLNAFDLFTYICGIKTTSEDNLNANQVSSTTNFNYSDNITTFTIVPTYIVYISSMSLTYTIDYSIC